MYTGDLIFSSAPSERLRPREEQPPLHVHRHLLRHPVGVADPDQMSRTAPRQASQGHCDVTESKKFDEAALSLSHK